MAVRLLPAIDITTALLYIAAMRPVRLAEI